MLPKILVHICCAPDGFYVLKLLQDNYHVSGFFYNPNIHPPEEYRLRLAETVKVSNLLQIPLIIGDYDDEMWFKATAKFKHEPEKGRRCNICYALRLEKTARLAFEKGFDLFTTTLTLSPWKKAAVINKIGRMLGKKWGINFLEADFKKKNGFKKSVELSHHYRLYRQNYCGCLYSKR
jgi:predicted adenine nucleotide alpha hydrolase (AANH) superfamily ATPase